MITVQVVTISNVQLLCPLQRSCLSSYCTRLSSIAGLPLLINSPEVAFRDQGWTLELSRTRMSTSLCQGPWNSQRESLVKGTWCAWTLSPTTWWTPLGSQQAAFYYNHSLFINYGSLIKFPGDSITITISRFIVRTSPPSLSEKWASWNLLVAAPFIPAPPHILL